jgi:magnesium chelatase family protein
MNAPSLAGLLKGGRQGLFYRPCLHLVHLIPPGSGVGPGEIPVFRILGAALSGVDGIPIEVEVRISSQLPRIDIVGLPEAAVRESAARVRAAISAIGVTFPARRVTVNLAPAGVQKSGAGLDLPIAIGILAASEAIETGSLGSLALVGELALDGRLRAVRGALARTICLAEVGARRVIVPRENGPEAGLAPGTDVRIADDLASVVQSLGSGKALPRAPRAALAKPPAVSPRVDLRDIRGQARGKRALEIMAAGGHGLLFLGPPGTGKTLLARSLPGLLPELEFEQALEVTRIHGATGRLDRDAPLMTERPFRAPHHTASRAGLLGGGSPPRPGEVSLAHRGVLFLDELPEFERRSLESLRQVIEERRVVIARAHGTSDFPAHFQLAAAANPCPCGWRLSELRDCRCDDASVARYSARLSGPLRDRIDLHVTVPEVSWSELDRPGELPDSASVRTRVEAARRYQARRLAGFGVSNNAEIPLGVLEAAVAATPDARALLARAVERLALSARGAHRVLRVARTVADLANEPRVGPAAVAEALDLREEARGGRTLA